MQEDSSEKVQQSTAEIESDNWLPPVQLTHLEPEQCTVVEKMLIEENAAFARDDNDIGSVEDLQMKINLTDTVPIQHTYTSIRTPLYKEVREHIEDMLVKGWIRKYKSAYSSLLVCIRKKNGSLRICVDFRQVNSKTVPDEQPVPKVQDILNNLGGNKWFTVLDQTRAYIKATLQKNTATLQLLQHLGVYWNGVEFHSIWPTYLPFFSVIWRKLWKIFVTQCVSPIWMTSWYIVDHSMTTWNM